MILVRQRRAEERHDPVAHHLVDGALVAVHRVHHALEHRVEELARLLGIAVGQQLHRALEVREQHGDLLALAFQRAPCEVRIFSARCLGVYVSGAGRPIRGRGEGSHGLAALQTEPGAAGQLRTTRAARKREAGPQPRQIRAWAGLSCWHRGHFMQGS